MRGAAVAAGAGAQLDHHRRADHPRQRGQASRLRRRIIVILQGLE